MSTTRSQKRRNNQQEAIESVSEGFVLPVVVENPCPEDQDVSMEGQSKQKSHRIEGSLLESLRASLKEEITSEIKSLLVESQREMLRLLKPETRENVRENTEEETENETRSLYTPTKLVRINSTQNNDTNVSRNNVKIHPDFISIQVVLKFLFDQEVPIFQIIHLSTLDIRSGNPIDK